jgi:hypothetical protein
MTVLLDTFLHEDPDTVQEARDKLKAAEEAAKKAENRDQTKKADKDVKDATVDLEKAITAAYGSTGQYVTSTKAATEEMAAKPETTELRRGWWLRARFRGVTHLPRERRALLKGQLAL